MLILLFESDLSLVMKLLCMYVTLLIILIRLSGLSWCAEKMVRSRLDFSGQESGGASLETNMCERWC
jgi:hypothetical protein